MDAVQDRPSDRPSVHIEATGVEKRYGGVRALRGVDLSIRRGEVHALVGENGAGKSTLGKILAGSVSADGGRILVNGRPVRYRRPSDARKDGIAIIDQELATLSHRTVLENVFLGSHHARLGMVSRRQQFEDFDRLVEEYGFSGLDPGRSRGTCASPTSSGSRSSGHSRAARNSSSWTSRPPRSHAARSSSSTA
ncbi:ATP-binding cassette domain-containing protein [Leucobacter soli]|uniref:ATP-binding cassette domain-containing protein n=1 Tax=Leucobacter soli TaxID=2812850 RepID=UPI003615332E